MNVQRFLEAVQHKNLTLSKSKSEEFVTSINILGYWAGGIGRWDIG